LNSVIIFAYLTLQVEYLFYNKNLTDEQN